MPQKITLEKFIKASIHRVKMVIWAFLFANIFPTCAAGIIEIWKGVAILLPRLEALTGFNGLLRALGR